MAVLKCKMCGGDISVSADKSVGTCNYCGSIMTIPKVNNERTANLFNRANYYRLQGDFERALVSYENILAEDSMNPEAYWCSVLCRYGVEYVDDPNTHQKIPTCHRTSYESIFDDLDYKKAVGYAGPIAKELYEKEAKQIDEIQKGILAISKLEAPYDIFISYKESDEAGARTKDSVLAQDLYSRLTKEGYRTFFSRISLEDKLGQQYEPYIFSALNTAKVMLVVGTSQDHFNAPWVKNEWGRFLALMKGDSNRILIPCYRDMNVYDLPEELSMFQCQDMGKIGFEQDLLHGIRKYINTERVQAPAAEVASLDRLLRNGKTYLNLNDYKSAEQAYQSATQMYPEDYRGWWGVLVCRTEDFTKLTIDRGDYDTWFRYVKKLAPAHEFNKLAPTYKDYIRKTSPIAARERLDLSEKQVGNYRDKINELQSKIQALQSCVESSAQERQNIEKRINEEYQRKFDRCEQSLRYAESQYKKINAASRGQEASKWLFAIAIGLPVLAVMSGTGAATIGIALLISCVLIVACGASGLPSRKYSHTGITKTQIAQYEKSVIQERNLLNDLKAAWPRNIRTEIAKHNATIADYQENVIPSLQREVLENDKLMREEEAIIADGSEAFANTWVEQQWAIVNR